jgi:F-type H+-transporting ATPase subunit b
MLEINPGLTIWTFIIFAALFVILAKTAWKPLLGSLKARETAIADSLSKAEQARTEAERIIEENRRERVRAEEETQKALREGREYADRMRAELMQKAQDEAKAMLTHAKAEIERDTRAALAQLRSEAADLAIMATSKLLDENLNDERHRQVVNRMIAEMPVGAGGNGLAH